MTGKTFAVELEEVPIGVLPTEPSGESFAVVANDPSGCWSIFVLVQLCAHCFVSDLPEREVVSFSLSLIRAGYALMFGWLLRSALLWCSYCR